MATTLNDTYQYIGRSSAVQAYKDNFYYYILLYAKTTAQSSTGKHTVSVKMRLACTADSTFYNYYTDGSIKINGVEATSWDGQKIPSAAWAGSNLTAGGVTYARYTDLREGSAVVDTKYSLRDITIATSFERNSISGTPPSWLPKATQITASVQVTLPAIPAASTISSARGVTLGNACSITWTPLSTSFRYKLKFAIENWSHTTEVIYPSKTISYTYTGYTIPLEVANQLPNHRKGTMTVTLYSYSDSAGTSQMGSGHSTTFEVTVPDNTDTKPGVQMTLNQVSLAGSGFEGLFIQGVTKIRATLSATGKYGTDIASYMMKVDGKFYYADDEYTSDFLATSGTKTVYGYATDDRGHIGEKRININVIPYSPVKIEQVSVVRCDKDANDDDSGTYVKIAAKRVYSHVIYEGVQKNYCEIRARYSDGREYSDWVTILGEKSLTSDNVSSYALFGGEISTQQSYTVQVQAIDWVGTVSNTYVVVDTEHVYWHRDGRRNALGLGKFNERDNAIDSAWDLYMNGHRITGVPEPKLMSDAVPKSYVDPADAKLEKSLDAPGWYKIGAMRGEMCAVVTLTVGGIFVNNQASPSMVDIATQHNQARMFLRLPSLADSQISKIGLMKELTTAYGVYAYYNTSNANTVKINSHVHMGEYEPVDFTPSDVTTDDLFTVIALKA